MLTLKRTDNKDKDFHILIAQLDQYLFEQYGQLQEFYGQYNCVEEISIVVLAYVEKELAGCGCFKNFDDSSVEVKRMFVAKEYRGKGIAGSILTELESCAAELGKISSVLELGNKQPEAIRLYTKQGYAVIPNYGQYIGMEATSICMKKELN